MSTPKELYVFDNHDHCITCHFIGTEKGPECRPPRKVYAAEPNDFHFGCIYITSPELHHLEKTRFLFIDGRKTEEPNSNRFEMIGQFVGLMSEMYDTFIVSDKWLRDKILNDDAEPTTYYHVNLESGEIGQKIIYGKLPYQNIINDIKNRKLAVFHDENDAVALHDSITDRLRKEKSALTEEIMKAINDIRPKTHIGGRMSHIKQLKGRELKLGEQYRLIFRGKLSSVTVTPAEYYGEPTDTGFSASYMKDKDGNIISWMDDITYIPESKAALYKELKTRESAKNILDCLEALLKVVDSYPVESLKRRVKALTDMFNQLYK